ncbi:hypothetical protein VTK73DRAFT_169 [Phialemonium thermophilum]|uniref:Uncharacterized protein n=1 Tax=Phialemonium thermophilum TaxID=223376 RepID=A0ABR3VWN0_9PEZI
MLGAASGQAWTYANPVDIGSQGDKVPLLLGDPARSSSGPPPFARRSKRNVPGEVTRRPDCSARPRTCLRYMEGTVVIFQLIGNLFWVLTEARFRKRRDLARSLSAPR